MAASRPTFLALPLKTDGTPVEPGERNVVGVEYMTPAITSANLQDQFGLDSAGEARLEALALTFNPHFAFF
ncbi:MAG: hypothetical protein H0X34_08635 [Chthoniobacterales bacterium]|nr:hypothetical protein [Chthoniobacterales bacterium]